MSYFLFVFIFSMPSQSFAENSGKRTTTYLMCKRIVEGRSQSIIVAMETLTEKKCKTLGLNKAKQYMGAGWKCAGFRGEEFFSCENRV